MSVRSCTLVSRHSRVIRRQESSRARQFLWIFSAKGSACVKDWTYFPNLRAKLLSLSKAFPKRTNSHAMKVASLLFPSLPKYFCSTI